MMDFDAYTGLVTRISTAYEEGYDIEFGPLPEVVIADVTVYEGLARDISEHLGIEADDATIHDAAVLYHSNKGMYDDLNHRVLISDHVVTDGHADPEQDGELVYVLAHELVHAYQANHGALIGAGLQKELARQRDETHGDYIRSLIDAVPVLSALEGQAEYMATNMFRSRATEFPAGVEFAESAYEERLAWGENDRRPAVRELMAARETLASGAIDMDAVAAALNASYHAYGIGYGYVAERVVEEDIAMDDLLEDMPRTLEELI